MPPGSASTSRDQFHSLARTATVVPVWREVVADLATPVAAYLRLVGDGNGFILESVEHERWGRWTFVGRNAAATLVCRDGRVELSGDLGHAGPVKTDRGVLVAMEDLLGRLHSPAVEGLPPLHGGLVGWLGYDVVREVEHLPSPPPDDRRLPDAVMSVIGDVAAFDHWRQRVTLIHNVIVGDQPTEAELDHAYERALVALDALCDDGATPLDEPVLPPPVPGEPMPDVTRSVAAERFRDMVEQAKGHIEEGDIFEVVASQRFELDLGTDPFDFYRVLRQVNPSPYMFYLRDPEVILAGSSPEMHVQVRDGVVTTRPIAGTRRRGRDASHDSRMAGELRESPKERAEPLMLVDLARNDLGRIAAPGSVRVDELMTLERYSHVMHMTSQVSADLAPGCSPIDVLRATLPAGTVSGAPKVRAMEIIDDLEVTRRGPYGGVVGYVDFSGNLDTAITLRTLVASSRNPAGSAWVQAGAGVVADSDAADEDLECANKAAALLAAVSTARRMRDEGARTTRTS
ncbi:MAG TPA: chorismate-binding protein [Acidimicrobiales bacterium]|nr:chorismate-binding protein [Acidimicrobiales bacterium]